MLPRLGIVPKLVLPALLALALVAPAGVRAITVADGFTYAGTNGFAASRALAEDYGNYPWFAAVGSLAIYEGTNSFTATGTLLNPEWVLTAGHNWASGAVTGLNFILGGVSHAADLVSLVQHPLWVQAPAPLPNEDVGPSQGWDVALFRLAVPITNTIAFPRLYTGSGEATRTGITLGAGIIGTGTQPTGPDTNYPPPIHAAMNVIDRATAQTNSGLAGGLLVNDFDGTGEPGQNTLGQDYNATGQPWIWGTAANTITNLDPSGTITGTGSAVAQLVVGGNIVEGGTAPGDSGGPTFIEDGGEWKLAGITSWGYNPWDVLQRGGDGLDGLYGDLSYMTRVSQVEPWISSVVPEPSTLALVTMGLAGAFWVARRKQRSGCPRCPGPDPHTF